jgi:hypothetical protein
VKFILRLALKAFPFLRPKERPGKFKLRDASVEGHGLQPEFHDSTCEQIRAACYGAREA